MNHLTSANLYHYLSNAASKWPLLKPQRLKLSTQIRKEVTRLMFKDVFPGLLLFNQGRSTYLARVR